MRIAFDPQIFCLQGVGGISRYVCALARNLEGMAGIQAQIFAPIHVNDILHRTFPDQGYRITPLPKADRWLCTINQLMAWPMMSLFSPDIVHETFFAPFSLAPRSARRVITVYDMIHEKFPMMFEPRNPTARWKRRAVFRADHVLCISEHTRQDLIALTGLPPERVTTTLLGFDPLKAPSSSTDQDSTTTMPSILFVGNRQGYKNFVRLLEAFAASSWLRTNFQLVCFGGGSLQPAELEHMARLGLSSKQVVQQSGGDSELATAYRKAAVFVYPSEYEGFGLPLLEAMSLDCPVICSNTSSLPEVAGDAAEYFPPVEVEAIREALERVLTSSTRRQELIERGKRRHKAFSWRRCAEETLAVYRRLT